MKVSTKWIRICNIACAVLLLALLLLQLMPFWTMVPCTCEGACEPAASKLEKPKVDATCEACSITYKWCQNLDRRYQVGLNPALRVDTSKEWTVSIQQFVWMPTFESTIGVQDYFEHVFNTADYKFMLNDVKDMPVLVFFFSLIGAYFGFAMSKKPLSAVLAFWAGIVATYTYLTEPIFQMGMLWQVHLVVGVLLILCSLAPVYECIRRAVVWLDPRKAS